MSAEPGCIDSQIAPKTTRLMATVVPSAGRASEPTGARTSATPTTVGMVTASTRSRKLKWLSVLRRDVPSWRLCRRETREVGPPLDVANAHAGDECFVDR